MGWCALDVAVQLLGQLVEGGVAVALGRDGRPFDFGERHELAPLKPTRLKKTSQVVGVEVGVAPDPH